MDYEKAYKAVLETATQWIKDGCTDKEKICLESVFPELRESEDERIRKIITDSVFYQYDAGVEYKDVLDYLDKLEKQKEPHYTKRNALFDKCVENCEPEIMKRVSDEVDEMLEKEQKLAEWSKKDEEMMTEIIEFLEYAYPYDNEFRIAWLKSLRPQPHWKPSEHQMNILKAVKEYVGRGSGYWGEALWSLIEDLEKLM